MKNINDYIFESIKNVRRSNVKYINIEFSFEFAPSVEVFTSDNELYKHYKDAIDINIIKDKISKLNSNECCILNTWGEIYEPAVKGDKKLFSDDYNYSVIVKL